MKMKSYLCFIAAGALLLAATPAIARNPARFDVDPSHGSFGSIPGALPVVTPGSLKNTGLITGFYNVICSDGKGFARLQTITKTIGGLSQMVVHMECAATESQVNSAGASFQLVQASTGVPSFSITLTQPITFQLVGGESLIAQANGISYVTPNSVHRRPGFKTLTSLGNNRYEIPLDAGTQHLQILSFEASGDTSNPCKRITADVNKIQINGSFVGITPTKAIDCGDCEL